MNDYEAAEVSRSSLLPSSQSLSPPHCVLLYTLFYQHGAVQQKIKKATCQISQPKEEKQKVKRSLLSIFDSLSHRADSKKSFRGESMGA